MYFFDVDQRFTGADGFDSERGTITFNELLRLCKGMAKGSRQTAVLAETTKSGRKTPKFELPWYAVGFLVTASTLTLGQLEHIEE